MDVKNNASGGKGPCGGHVDRGGKREGMVGEDRPNHPGGRSFVRPAVDKVQRLQDRLRDAAKLHPGRRFHALYDRICRSDVLQEAWKRVKRNRGAAGVDSQTIAAIEEYGVERFLDELQAIHRLLGTVQYPEEA
jgi:RNA-directed DNA polymerase